MANSDWIKYDEFNDTYVTKDGTVIGAELAESQQCLADVLYIAALRSKQRKERQATKENPHD